MIDEYLSDEWCYIQLERYLYDRFFLECNEKGMGIKEFKAPLYNTAFSDGTPFREGNPIFSTRNEITGKILRVVLDEDADPLVSCRVVSRQRHGLRARYHSQSGIVGTHKRKNDRMA